MIFKYDVLNIITTIITFLATANVAESQTNNSGSPYNATPCCLATRALAEGKVGLTAAELAYALPPPTMLPKSLQAQMLENRNNWLALLRTANYDRSIPPNYPESTLVEITNWPFDLETVNERDHFIKMSVSINMSWTDSRLRWNDTIMTENQTIVPCFNAIDVPILAIVKDIWTPNVLLHARQDPLSTPFFYPMRLVIHSNGLVRYMAYTNDARGCPIRTKFFPFDVQACPLVLEASDRVELRHEKPQTWKQENDRLQNAMAAIKKYRFWYESNEWTMHATPQHINATLNNGTTLIAGDSSIIIYPFFLTRKSDQLILTWIVTPIVLSMSSVFGMYAGCVHDEHYSFGGAIIVTLTLMLADVRSLLGVGFDGYPILGKMYLGLGGVLILATLSSGIPSWVERYLELMEKSQQKSNGNLNDLHVTCIQVGRRTSKLVQPNKWLGNKQQLSATNSLAYERQYTLWQKILMRSQTGFWLLPGFRLLDLLLVSIMLSLQVAVVGYCVWAWSQVEREKYETDIVPF